MRLLLPAAFVLLTSCNVFFDLEHIDCSGLGDCDRGWQCVDGGCVERATCNADRDCDNGLRCEAGFCFVVCETAVQCRDARVCQSDTCVNN